AAEGHGAAQLHHRPGDVPEGRRAARGARVLPRPVADLSDPAGLLHGAGRAHHGRHALAGDAGRTPRRAFGAEQGTCAGQRGGGLMDKWNWDRFLDAWPYVLDGLWVTIQFTV